MLSVETLQDRALDSGWLPQFVIRRGIRYQLRQRAESIRAASEEDARARKMQFIKRLRERPIAVSTEKANEQHYEVGTGVLRGSLGPRMKYSCCLYPKGSETLGQAEVEMMRSYVAKAELKDGMKILDLGCGWGSLSLYLAQLFPKSTITAFSNSRTQKTYIEEQAKQHGLTNIKGVTGDVVTYKFKENHYDRVISIELFEHMKNYEELMSKIAKTLRKDGEGKLFVHIFAHRESPYDYEDGWMTKNFFQGGTMPCADLLLFFQKEMVLEHMWWVNGRHYAKTCEDWLAKMTENKNEIWPHLEETYGKENAATWFYRWQIFYMACAELFAWEGGDTWGVCHYLFTRPKR